MKFIITEEQNEKLNQKVRFMVNKYGLERVLELFDNNKDIIKRAYADNPESFLVQFNDLKPKEIFNKIYYVDKDGNSLFMYYPNEKPGNVYIHYNKIWKFFNEVIGLERFEIKDIIKNWLGETYNLKGITHENIIVGLNVFVG